MAPIFEQLDVLVAKVEERRRGAPEPHPRERIRLARELEVRRLEVVHTEMRVCERVHELPRLVSGDRRSTIIVSSEPEAR